MTMSFPGSGTSGRLFYWSKQGISLQELKKMIDDAIANGGSGGGGGIAPGELAEIQAAIAAAQADADIAQSQAAAAQGSATTAQAAASSALNTVGGLATLLGKYVPGTSYTAIEGDENVELRFTAEGAVTAVIPLDASLAIPVGSQLPYAQEGPGAVTWVGEAGVDLRSSDTATLRRQYSSGVWLKTATNQWRLSGEVSEAVRPRPVYSARIPGGINVTTGNVSLAVPAGDNRLLLVGICTGNSVGQATAITCTLGGVALTPVGTADSWTALGTLPQRRVDLYMMLAPPVATSSLVVTSNATTIIDATAIVFTGVNQSAPLGAPVTWVSADAEICSVTTTDATWSDLIFASFSGRTTALPTVPPSVDIHTSTLKAADNTILHLTKQGSSDQSIVVTQPTASANRSAMVGVAIKGI